MQESNQILHNENMTKVDIKGAGDKSQMFAGMLV